MLALHLSLAISVLAYILALPTNPRGMSMILVVPPQSQSLQREDNSTIWIHHGSGSKKQSEKEVVQGQGFVALDTESISWIAADFDCLWNLVKDKAQHAVILDKATSDKLNKDVQSYRLITVAVLVDRLKINGSVARRCLADLEERGVIKKVVGHSKLSIYSTFYFPPFPKLFFRVAFTLAFLQRPMETGQCGKSQMLTMDSTCGHCCGIGDLVAIFYDIATAPPSNRTSRW